MTRACFDRSPAARRSPRCGTAIHHGSFLSSSFLEPAQKANLPGMVDVVKADATNLPQKLCGEPFALPISHPAVRGAVLPLKQFAVGAPGSFRQLARFGTRKEIAALERERAAFASFDAAPHGIFPVGCVESQFPDVAPAGAWPPRGLLGGYSADGLPHVWAMPGRLFVGFVEQAKEQLILVHGRPLRVPKASRTRRKMFIR